MSFLTPKLLVGFDQIPLLERLEYLYDNKETLFDAHLLDKAVSHFEEEITKLEIEEFRESGVKDTKKERFETLLNGLKIISANIKKTRERAERSAKENLAAKAQINEWSKKLNALIETLEQQLKIGRKVTGRRYWNYFQKLKTSQPDYSGSKKLEEWKNFLNEIPEYKAYKENKIQKIKNAVNKRKNIRKKLKVGLMTLSAAALSLLVFLGKNLKEKYDIQKAKEDAVLESKKHYENIEFSKNNHKTFLKILGQNKPLNKQESALFDHYLDAALNNNSNKIKQTDEEIKNISKNIELFEKNLNRIVAIIENQHEQQIMQKLKVSTFYLNLIMNEMIIVKAMIEKISSEYSLADINLIDLMIGRIMSNIEKINDNNAIFRSQIDEVSSQIDKITKILDAKLGENKYAYLETIPLDKFQFIFSNSFKNEPAIVQRHVIGIFIGKISKMLEQHENLAPRKSGFNVQQNYEELQTALRLMDENPKVFIETIGASHSSYLSVGETKVRFPREGRGKFIISLLLFNTYQRLANDRQKPELKAFFEQKTAKWRKELNSLKNLSESAKIIIEYYVGSQTPLH